MKSQRHRARQTALQILYEIDITDHSPGTVLSHQLKRVDPPLNDSLERLVREIVSGVTSHRQALDQVIGRFAPEWPVNQIATIDRNILRMALWEMNFYNTPVKVVINEAVELGKEFGADTSPKFINGVLGAAVRNDGDMRDILGLPSPPPVARS